MTDVHKGIFIIIFEEICESVDTMSIILSLVIEAEDGIRTTHRHNQDITIDKNDPLLQDYLKTNGPCPLDTKDVAQYIIDAMDMEVERESEHAATHSLLLCDEHVVSFQIGHDPEDDIEDMDDVLETCGSMTLGAPGSSLFT